MSNEVRYAGLVGVVGRPNVGKSTLVNALVGEKVSIVTAKPQTTRHRIMGVSTRGDRQFVFVDTPGIHSDTPRRMNRDMNRTAQDAARDADVVLFLIQAGQWNEEDQAILKGLKKLSVPVGLVINKVDRLDDRKELLPFMEELTQAADFHFVVPLSALKKENLEPLMDELSVFLPESPAFFPADQHSDQSPQMVAAEVIREKLMLRVHQEVPYALAVQIQSFKREGRLRRLEAIIWIERDGQKGIVIGKGGQVLKAIGTAARKELESLWDCRVHLDLWVKVRAGWPDDPRLLGSMGIGGE
ncbi:GTP-binding protein Era [Natronospira proteinivora]|uniref:GTPase Era n=1 Tax=Natronospira proteinivora TaxID=1807133 RepID=A0ABT1G8L3_9GAMM|nr:GTPase Era [Natronospira proteinivora]MCP1726678.1 GTP-binding protein Era [Natronospira proteinivora]